MYYKKYEDKNYIPVFWYSSNNFGDNLSHYLVKKISGKTPVLVTADEPCLKFMITGSILNNEVANAVVWGCGFGYFNDSAPMKKDIIAVRGKLSGELLKNNDIPFREIYGDPALLLPKLYTPKNNNKKWMLGILPHYVDTISVLNRLNLNKHELEKKSIYLIDINDSIENVIDQINSCERIISSSLHGIIAAHAYKIPCNWVKFTDLIFGDDFKYYDYYSTTDIKDLNFIDLRGTNLNINFLEKIKLSKHIICPKITIDIDKLYKSCPFTNLD